MVIGVLVGAMALGMSAFTNAKPNMNKAKTIPSGYLVQTANGIYEYRSSLSGGICNEPVVNSCHYTVGSSNNIPNQAQYTKAEVDSYNGVSNPSSEKELFEE